MPPFELLFVPTAPGKEDEAEPAFDQGSPRMVHGHLGITRAAVEGIVRMQVSPDFSLSHTHVTTRPVLDITLRGVARTTRNNNWLEDELVNVTQQINDACDQWLARDEATGRLRTIMPGIYDVPFSFTLPPNLPPSFRAWDAAVKYTLTATLRFRETIEPDRSSLFTRQVSEIVTVRKYHPDHIVTPLDVMSQRPSSPVYEFEHAESDSSATNNEFSFGELGLDFMKPLTLSNVGSDEEIVHYTVSVPHRSYGPDEVVSANLTIEKLPDGFAVHHVDMILEAEIQADTKDGPMKSRELLVKHRDVPAGAGHYFNRDIQTYIFLPTAQSPSRDTRDLEPTTPEIALNAEQNATTPSNLISEPEEIDPDHPPQFTDLSRRYTLSTDFDSRPLERQRSDLLEILDGRGPSRNGSIHQDAGIMSSANSVYRPWNRRESRDSGTMVEGPLRRHLSADFRMSRSMSSPASRGSLRGGSGMQGSPLPPMPASGSTSFFAGENLRVPLVMVRSGSMGNVSRMPGVSPRLAPLRESHVPTPSDSPEPEPVQDGIPEVQGDLDAESGDANMSSSSATNGPNDEAPTEMVTTRHKEGFKWDTYMLPPPGMRPSVFTFGTSTPDPDIDSDSETDGSGHPPPQQRNVTPPSLPPIRTRSNSQVPTMQGRFSSLAPRSTTQSGAGTPRLRNTTSTGSRLAQPTTPAPTLSDAAPQPTTDLPNFRAVMDKIHGLGLEAPNKTIKPLTTFTSPQLRVRHFLRLEIVCHKPLPFGMGSGPIVLPEADRKKSLWRKAVPIGFRHRTCVEVPVVIHHADAVERKFLKSYLYGPQPLGVGQNGAPAV